MIVAYLLGSIPFGVVLAKMRKVDLRQHGSGNIGATNVARTLGKTAGILTLLGDAAKGAFAVGLADVLLNNPRDMALAGLCAFLGHLYPVFLRFKGGKGVATGLGIFLYLMPPATGMAMVIFATVLATTRYVSLSSILSALALPVSGFVFQQADWSVNVACVVAALVIVRHHENIQRLMAGKENKFASK